MTIDFKTELAARDHAIAELVRTCVLQRQRIDGLTETLRLLSAARIVEIV